MKILHIAVHVGGGIGSAFAGLSTCGQEQSILLLEEPEDRNSLARVKDAGFRILINPDSITTEQELKQADIVVFNWYHHPKLAKFLHSFPSIAIRSILWSHVSGNYFPHIPGGFLTEFDQVMFTTPFSLHLPQVESLGNDFLREHCQVVYGMGDLRRIKEVHRTRGTTFSIGYTGTLSFCKLHPAFVDFCAAVTIPNARFVLAGSPSAKQQILSSARRKGIDKQFEFLGHVSDISHALSQMDIYGYLLNPQHFGTTENALLEAMAAGLPVVALDQCVERWIIRDGLTGLLVHSPEEYGNALRFLYENPQKAARLGQQARTDTLEQYRIRDNQQCFLTVCQKALLNEKHRHKFAEYASENPSDWFMSCVNDGKDCFEENRAQDAGWIFHEHTKGSPIHYHTLFPENPRLALWAKQLL